MHICIYVYMYICIYAWCEIERLRDDEIIRPSLTHPHHHQPFTLPLTCLLLYCTLSRALSISFLSFFLSFFHSISISISYFPFYSLPFPIITVFTNILSPVHPSIAATSVTLHNTTPLSFSAPASTTFSTRAFRFSS